MFERRRQVASPGSLLVVTLLFVWACSSGDYEDASVTTSGGSGSEVRAGGAGSTSSQSMDAPADGGNPDPGAAVSSDAAGTGGVLAVLAPASDGGAGAAPSAGSHSAPPAEVEAGFAGTAQSSNGGAFNGVGGAAGGVAGKTSSAAGAPFIAPTCDPVTATDESDTLYLPCDVNAAMYICRSCHSSPPTKPVSTSYVTYADIKPRAAAIYDMVRTGYMPRPPFKLSDAQQKTILTWLGQNGSCAVGVPSACQ